MHDVVLTNCRLATMVPSSVPYGLVEKAAVAISKGRIAWAGPAAELPEPNRQLPARDLDGRLVTPGLVDCHTHLVHAGNRAHEFEQRLEGASYADIARAGGGIISTVRATRAADEEQLLVATLARADELISQGVTTVEIKSGYGLDRTTELRCLRVARRVAAERRLRVRTTFLGAHAIPPEYAGRSSAYIDEVCIPTLADAANAGLVDAVDGFCEGIAFSTDEIERVFAVAHRLGLPVKLHAEQLSHLGGASLAARHGALSADHLEYMEDDDAEAMARAGTVAVLLPGAFYTLRETRVPPVASLRRHGVPIAIATDCNPGSSPTTSLLLAMNMACTLFRMTPQEALAGATRNGARALGLTDCGEVRTGLRADLAVWNVEEPAELAYRFGSNPLAERIFGGDDERN